MFALIAATLDCAGADKNSLGCMLKLNPSNSTTVGSYYPKISSFLNLLIPLSLVIAGVILLFLLVGGGFAIIASGGNAKSVESGKNQITGAIIGFAIIFLAYILIQIIQTITGVPILNAI